MSPYIFVVCMEVLTQLLTQVAARGIIKYHYQCAPISLTHLSFADDLLIFSKATSSSLQGIKTLMDDFYLMSGLKVNYSKSEVFSSGVQSSLQVQLANLLDLQIGNLLVRYLGVHLISGKLKEGECKALINKITSRISS